MSVLFPNFDPSVSNVLMHWHRLDKHTSIAFTLFTPELSWNELLRIAPLHAADDLGIWPWLNRRQAGNENSERGFKCKSRDGNNAASLILMRSFAYLMSLLHPYCNAAIPGGLLQEVWWNCAQGLSCRERNSWTYISPHTADQYIYTWKHSICVIVSSLQVHACTMVRALVLWSRGYRVAGSIPPVLV